MAKKPSLYVINAVRKLSDVTLHDFNVLAHSKEFDSIKDSVKNIEHNTMVSWFNLSHQNSRNYLLNEGLFCKGIIFGLSMFVKIVEASPEEVDRRENTKKRKSNK